MGARKRAYQQHLLTCIRFRASCHVPAQSLDVPCSVQASWQAEFGLQVWPFHLRMVCLADGSQSPSTEHHIPCHDMVNYEDLQDLQGKASQGSTQPVCFVPSAANDSVDALTSPNTAIQMHTNTAHAALSGAAIYESLRVRIR